MSYLDLLKPKPRSAFAELTSYKITSSCTHMLQLESACGQVVPARSHATFFTQCASQIATQELEMHDALLRDWNISTDDVQATPLQPSSLLYTSFLREQSSAIGLYEGAGSSAPPVPILRHFMRCFSYEHWKLPDDSVVVRLRMHDALRLVHVHLASSTSNEALHLAGVAAILPCYWVYQHVGQRLKQQGSPNAHYQAWIDLYGGDEFDKAVEQVEGSYRAAGSRIDRQAEAVVHGAIRHMLPARV